MIWTAIAMTESGTLGQARGRDLTVPRPGGDSVSRYGIAMSVAHVPAAWAAPLVEERFGADSSQPLFLIAPFVFVVAGAIAAGLSARLLGAGRGGARTAILLATVAGPFATYAAMPTSEALQGAALALVFVSALMARDTGAVQPAVASGIAAGVAVLTKSSLVFVAPFAALPLFVGANRRVTVRAFVAGLLPLLVCWMYLEVVRFGHPFASYSGERFSHGFFDGTWRLLVGPNKGLLWYFPAIVAAAVAVGRDIRVRATALVTLSAVLPGITLLAMAAPWWSWDGSFGWGPRLLVPAVPLLAVVAALEIERSRRSFRVALLMISVIANLPGLLVHATLVRNYELLCTWPLVSHAEAERLPTFARRGVAEHARVVPSTLLAKTSLASPFISHTWFFLASAAAARGATGGLMMPPWVTALPEVRPESDEFLRDLVLARAFNVWGRGFWPTARERSHGQVFDAGLADQVLRAQELGDRGLARHLVTKLSRLAPSGFVDSLMLENYRLANDRAAAVRYLASVSLARRSHPGINVVLALFERDAGNETMARQLLRSVADDFPDSPVQRAILQPLEKWPATFAAMTQDDRLSVGGPGGNN